MPQMGRVTLLERTSPLVTVAACLSVLKRAALTIGTRTAALVGRRLGGASRRLYLTVGVASLYIIGFFLIPKHTDAVSNAIGRRLSSG